MAPLGKPRALAVVADTEHLGQVGGRDHAAHLEPRAGRTLGRLFGHADVVLVERDSVGRLLAFGSGFLGSHFGQVNTLVYTHFANYNAQDVGARTLVRASAGMPPGRDGRRGVPGVEPGPQGGRPVARRRRAQGTARGRWPGPGYAGRRAPLAPVPDPIGSRGSPLGPFRAAAG